MKKIKVALRNMKFATAAVKDVKHVALVPEVAHALAQWIKAKTGSVAPGVLIGGIVMSFYSKPRYTEDIDLLFLTEESIPSEVEGFRHSRKGAFEDCTTHVEIKLVTAKSINVPHEVVKKVFDTAVVYDGLKVASLEALIVLKLYGADHPKRTNIDLGDIDIVLEHNPHINLDGWHLNEVHKARLKDALSRLE